MNKKQLQQLAWRWRGIMTAPIVILLVYIIRATGILQGWELAVFDHYMRSRPQPEPDNRIVIVGIDEKDVAEIGIDPFPDEIYAQLLEKLIAMNPKAIGLDIYRNVPVCNDPLGHDKLVNIFESYDNIIGIEKVIVGKQESREMVGPPPALKAKGQVAANDLPLDPDGKIRRVFITVKPEDQTIRSLGATLAGIYLNTEGIEEVDWAKKFPHLKKNDGSYLRVGNQGYEIILNYRGGAGSFTIVSLSDVLNNRLPSDWGRDRLILIGKVSESFNDVFPVPYTTTANTRMSGAEIHANVASQIIGTVMDDYPIIKTFGESQEWFWIGLWTFVGTIIAWKKRYIFSPLDFVWIITPSIIVLVITNVAFVQGYWLPLIPTVLGLWLSQGVIIGLMAYKASTIRHTFGRYLSHKIVANLIENQDSLKIEGDKQTITVLVSDLRGFTAISEQQDPEILVKILNYYFQEMTEIIDKHEGIINKFLGDGILTLFGVPLTHKDDAVRAIKCALEMQLELEKVNKYLRSEYPEFPFLEMGIGINTGEVFVGNLGSEKRTEYGVIGNQINLAYRIESCTIGGQILISDSTKQEAEKSEANICIGNCLEKQEFKGVQEPQTIYDVKGIKYNDNGCSTKPVCLDFPKGEFYVLPNKIQCHYYLVHGKDIDKIKYQLTWLEITLDTRRQIYAKIAGDCTHLSPLSNIKINFVDTSLAKADDDIYAKVIQQNLETQEVEIVVTSAPNEVKDKLYKLYQQLQNKQKM